MPTLLKSPFPKLTSFFRAIKAFEEHWISRNDREYEEANHMGENGGGSSYGNHKAKESGLSKSSQRSDSRICYCCERTGHSAKECPMREKTCNVHKRASCYGAKGEKRHNLEISTKHTHRKLYNKREY